jgi:membrane fusion protein, multidrug efflux system
MNLGDLKRNRLTRQAGAGRLLTAAILVLLALVAGGVFRMLQRRTEFKALAKETEEMAVPTVAVIHPVVEATQEDLALPGTMQANVESPIYARTNGYLKRWYHDIGTRVKQGELLAEIDTPEVDQDLAQAQAMRQQITANLALAKSSAERWQSLRKSDSVSQQEADERTSQYVQMQANLAAADASVKRLQDLESFKRIFAPFSGVITRRNAEIGTLVNAGNTGARQELFILAQTDPIRVFAYVPEVSAAGIHPGLAAYLELTQYPGQKFEGKVVRTANAIDTATRTLLTEVDVANHQGQLLPGGYAQVHLRLKVQGDRLQLPGNALLFRAEGLRAVTVDANNRVHLRPLTIGRDYGNSLEVLQGISKDDLIVLNPPDSLEEGTLVRVKPTPPPPAPAGAPK